MTDTAAVDENDLTNARTRIVGSRDGALADAVVGAVAILRALRARVLRLWARVGRVVTPVGWATGLMAVGAFLAGYAFGWVEAIVIAWGITLVAAFAVLSVLGRTMLETRISLASSRVVVGDRAPGDIVARNRSRHRVPGARLELPVGYGLAEFAVPSLGGDGAFSDVFVVPTARRGIITVGPVRTVRGDPIGLVRREISWHEAVELYVHPRTITIPSMSTGFVRDLEGSPTRDLTASDISFHALREYVPGDERRTIHWKSTAKTGTYMVRQFEETRRSHLMVALSLAEAEYASDDEFELAVSVAGSLGVRAIRDGRTVSVATSERTPDFAKRPVVAIRQLSTGTPGRLLDDLARIERSRAQLRIVDLARIAAESATGISVAFLLCGSIVSATQLRRAATQFPAGLEVVAVICDPGAVPRLRRVGELSVLTIGYLEDLQKSLARSRAA